jgi:hexosaminidase
VNASLVPRPRVHEERAGSVTLTSPLRVAVPPAFTDVVDTFGDDLAASVGWLVLVVGVDDEGDVCLELDDTLPDEGYTIRVGDDVVLRASSAPGFAHALTTLRQLGPAHLWSRERTTMASWTLDGTYIADAPAFVWRGAHLDVARHFFGVEVVTRMIDLLAMHHMNRLHLHLNDDQGWRIEVPQWPRLTSVGATRSGSPLGHESEDRRDTEVHGGYFDARDVATILAHAARRRVVVVPEIDLPGHAQAALAAYPQFANVDEPLEVWDHWGISDHVLNVEPATLDFAEDVVRSVARLFPGAPVHIGGDECPTVEWAQSAAAREVMAGHGFADARQLQGLYTRRLSEALVADGHEVLAWDEVLDAEVAPGTVICAWRGVDQGVEAARRGFDVVMAPMEYLYLDWLSSDSPEEPVAVAPAPFVTTWEKVYGFDVVPDGLEAVYAGHVRGAQVQLWTEYIDSRERLDYMAFPRLSAFAEVVWGTAGEVREFRERLQTHLARLDAMGVAYRRLDAEG